MHISARNQHKFLRPPALNTALTFPSQISQDLCIGSIVPYSFSCPINIGSRLQVSRCFNLPVQWIFAWGWYAIQWEGGSIHLAVPLGWCFLTISWCPRQRASSVMWPAQHSPLCHSQGNCRGWWRSSALKKGQTKRCCFALWEFIWQRSTSRW